MLKNALQKKRTKRFQNVYKKTCPIKFPVKRPHIIYRNIFLQKTGLQKHVHRRILSICTLSTAICCIILQQYLVLSVSRQGQLQPKTKLQIDASELQYFPLAYLKDSRTGTVYTWDFIDSWHTERTFGGERVHEGCDIMTEQNLPGLYPVISISDGIVEKIGWLKLGGYRIGIRTANGLYLYYAHLESYFPELQEDSTVKAGDCIGFAGNSGYGPEGTTGQFATHLHIGFYVTDTNGKETAVNPYPYLVNLKQHSLTYDYPK